ncbi:hypothetical protein AVEN_240206-1 [Araneus ventricosus]|uniref:Uncharacterized protein n=1 Tax=Araneus ventricosus TaxID=182803 RepID=A0A4Y2R3E2_ARAVE|nr:hypothetical protein AVEN_240206-1 [Araneus ventricosus]
MLAHAGIGVRVTSKSRPERSDCDACLRTSVLFSVEDCIQNASFVSIHSHTSSPARERRSQLAEMRRANMREINPCVKQAIHLSSKMEFLEPGKEKPIVKVENLSNLEQIVRNGGIQKNLKYKAKSTDSNLRPRREGSGKIKDLPTMAPRVEARNETRNPRVRGEETGWQEFCEFEPCLKTNL